MRISDWSSDVCSSDLELDGFLLAATEELARLEHRPIDGARTEAFLADLWQRTFARVAAAEEAWLERSFIKRGRAFVERLYPEADRKSVVSGKSVSVRVDLGGRRIIKKKKKEEH